MSKTIPKPEALAIVDPVWEDADIQALRDYIGRNPRFLQYLAARVPKIEVGTMEQAALLGARHAGYEELFSVLAGMVSQNNVSEKSPFIGNEPESE